MVLCQRSGSHRKVKQNDKLRPVQDSSSSLAVFKVTARDQGHYKGPSGHLLHTVTFLVVVFFNLNFMKRMPEYNFSQ